MATPKIVAQLRELWMRLGRTQQIALVGIGGGALVFAFIFLNMGRSRSYVTAFTDLDPKDSAAAADELKADKIPYQVSADGGTIKVAPDKLADARLKLAAKGLPQGGAVGFELFDKTSFGVTDFVQNINYQRALEGELQRTINSLSEVESSRVHIVVPKQELFVSQQKPATASVMLKLRPGRQLDDNALRGLSHLVARSVQGLDEKNITIIDGSGKMLFDGGTLADNSVGLTGTQLDVEKKLEKSIETQVQTLLDQVAGPNRSAVRVKADMDFSQQEQLSETYQPGGPNDQGVPRSSSTTQETYNGNGQPGGTPPGAGANNPNTPAAVTAAAAGASQYQRTETTTNYEVSKNTQKTTRGPGQVKRLSVSVLLDSSISDQDAAGLRDAIAAAAGIDPKRGDQIVVTTAAFSGNQAADAGPVAIPGQVDAIVKYGKLAVPLVAALIVLFIVWRMSRSVTPRRARIKVVDQPALASAQMPALDAQEMAMLEPPEPMQALPEPKRIETPQETARRKQIYDRMSTLATANPEAVAEIIHSWMSQDDPRKK